MWRRLSCSCCRKPWTSNVFVACVFIIPIYMIALYDRKPRLGHKMYKYTKCRFKSLAPLLNVNRFASKFAWEVFPLPHSIPPRAVQKYQFLIFPMYAIGTLFYVISYKSIDRSFKTALVAAIPVNQFCWSKSAKHDVTLTSLTADLLRPGS